MPWSRIALLILGGVSAIAMGLGAGFCIKQATRVRHEVASAAPVETAPSVAKAPSPSETVAKPPAPSKPAPLGFQGIRRGYPEEFRRIRSPLEEYKLRAQLADSPQIVLEESPGSAASELLAHARAHLGSWAEPAPHPPLLTSREDLVGLPMLMGSDCYMSDAQAVSLHELSGRLHGYLNDAKEAGERSTKSTHIEGSTAGAEHLGARLQMDSQALWQTSDAVPTLVQILQVEEAPYRRLLVRLLSRIGGPRATEALARRAVFDLARIVREEAVFALRNRPEAEYHAILLDGLRHPWPAAAEFAAEAIVNLNQLSAIPQLVAMLGQPDPSGPVSVKSKDGETFVVREMVQVNHLKNCLLCHPPSANEADRVRGLVPNRNQAAVTPNQTPVKSFGIYGGGGRCDFFARAEVTYLRQDFSVMRPVHKGDKASHDERFDFVVRTRPAGLCELTEKPEGNGYPQRQSVLFALRELTGEDLGSDARAWEERLYPNCE